MGITSAIGNQQLTMQRKNIVNEETIFQIDAKGKVLGRVASLASCVVLGKYSNIIRHNEKIQGHLIILNSDKVIVSGKKYWKKYYFNHSHGSRSGAGIISSYRVISFQGALYRRPHRVLAKAIIGMLPNFGGNLVSDMGKLGIYTDLEMSYSGNFVDVTHLLKGRKAI